MKKEAKKLTKDLLTFIDNAPTMYHASEEIKKRLIKNGFKQLDEGKPWKLQKGGAYFIERNNSAVIAFRIGKKTPAQSGFKIVGAHTDSPALKLKPDSEKISGNCARVTIEVYGGPILNTWLDRDLSLAGRVMVKGKNGYKAHLVDFKKPMALIPNLAIHLNREVNKGVELNRQNHMPVVYAVLEKTDEKDVLKNMIAKKLNVKVADIGESDLYFYDTQKGVFTGRDEEIFSIGKIDNLAMCHSILTALEKDNKNDETVVGVFFDNEEIGSQTPMGANSTFLRGTLERIVSVTGGKNDDFHCAIANSFLISADGAHAYHPNFSEKQDPAYAPVMNGGPVIKMSATFRYATTAETAAYFESLCEKAKAPCQKLINRSDVPSGSTIGPLSAALLGMKTIDVGNALWAMHSIRESAGVLDHYYMTEVLKQFYK